MHEEKIVYERAGPYFRSGSLLCLFRGVSAGALFVLVLVFASAPVLFLFFIYPFLEQYTKKGRECLGKLRGLRQYILVAEKDRIEMLAGENPEDFYHVLPYAYVLGVSDVYLKKFEDVPIQDPSWMAFSDGMTMWVVMMLLNRNIMALSVTLNYTLATHIISSVAKMATGVAISRIGGGGGFSGGGSGGGGGGRF